MFTFKKLVFTPQVLICYALLLLILVAVVASKPVTHFDKDSDGVVREYTAPGTIPNASPLDTDSQYESGEEPVDTTVGLYGTQDLTWRDMKSYQLSITPDGKYVIVYDYDRVVGVLPLDNNCNLTNLIATDND